MPMMAVLKHLHPMISVDLHDEVAPPGVPVPKIPHLVAGMLGFPPWGLVTGKINGTVWTTAGMTMSQGTDMGFLIPHIPLPPAPANILAPVLTLTSGSKSHFGAHNHVTPTGPIAFACLVYVNLNLNCGGPTAPPGPGFVFAVFQTTMTGVTVGDIIAGALHYLVDTGLQFVLNRFFGTKGPGGKALNWLTGKIAGAIASRVTAMGVRLSTLGVEGLGELIQAGMKGSRLSLILGYGGAEQLGGILAGYAIGTPVGYSPGSVPVSKGETGIDGSYDPSTGQADPGLQSKGAEAIDNLFNDPTVEDHPSAPPTDAGAPDASVGPDAAAAPDASATADAGAAGDPGASNMSSEPEPSSTSTSGGATSTATDQGGVCLPDDEGGGTDGGTGGSGQR